MTGPKSRLTRHALTDDHRSALREAFKASRQLKEYANGLVDAGTVGSFEANETDRRHCPSPVSLQKLADFSGRAPEPKGTRRAASRREFVSALVETEATEFIRLAARLVPQTDDHCRRFLRGRAQISSFSKDRQARANLRTAMKALDKALGALTTLKAPPALETWLGSVVASIQHGRDSLLRFQVFVGHSASKRGNPNPSAAAIRTDYLLRIIAGHLLARRLPLSAGRGELFDSVSSVLLDVENIERKALVAAIADTKGSANRALRV